MELEDVERRIGSRRESQGDFGRGKFVGSLAVMGRSRQAEVKEIRRRRSVVFFEAETERTFKEVPKSE